MRFLKVEVKSAYKATQVGGTTKRIAHTKKKVSGDNARRSRSEQRSMVGLPRLLKGKATAATAELW